MKSIHGKSPIAFAHRGGRAHFRENTLEAFRHAIDSGLTAVETDAWLSSDGEVVLDHDGVVRSKLRLRKRPVENFARHVLPSHIPTLADLCELIGPDTDVQIDVKGSNDIAAEIVKTWRKHWPNSMHRLWLAHDGYKTSDWRRVVTWRELDDRVHLVDSTVSEAFRHFDYRIFGPSPVGWHRGDQSAGQGMARAFGRGGPQRWATGLRFWSSENGPYKGPQPDGD